MPSKQAQTKAVLVVGGLAVLGVILWEIKALARAIGDWVFSEEACLVEPSEVGVWDQVIFSAVITSHAAETITKTVSLMIRHVWPPGIGGTTDWMEVTSFSATLEPEGTAIYQTPPGLVLIAQNDTIELKLVDSDGFESKTCRAVN